MKYYLNHCKQKDKSLNLASVILIIVLGVITCVGFFVGLYFFEWSATNVALILFVLGIIAAKFIYPYLLRLQMQQKNVNISRKKKPESKKEATMKENNDYEEYENEESEYEDYTDEDRKEYESEYESHPLTKLFESLRIAQDVSDPLHISKKLFFNKKDLFDFLAIQSKAHKRVSNFAFFESPLTHPLRKKHLKAILDLCNISLYENKSRKKFKENLRFVSKANPKFALLILEKQSREILNIISINDNEINSYDLSLEIREKFEKISAYPQAKWSNDDVFCLLYDSFRTRYSERANIEAFVGSIESFSKIITQKLQKSEKKHIIFGYINRWDKPLINGGIEQFKKLMLDLGQYFDIDLLRIASHSDSNFCVIAFC